jgi:peptidoglycan/LPS O-acetylase OafA/YrhL
MNRLNFPNLTSLRFFLALLVVIFHIPQFCQNRGFPFFNDFPILNKGYEAVYMFFSISGFLIIKQLYNEKLITDSIKLKAFFLRRVLRIFPLYYLILILGLFYYRLILPYFGYEFQSNYDVKMGILLSITFFSNIFATYQPGGILEILWSLGIEEQFYLIIAPLIFLLPKRIIAVFLFFFTVIYFVIYFSFQIFSHYQMLFFYFSFSGLCSLLMYYKKISLFLIKTRLLIITIFLIYFTTSFFKENLSEFIYHLMSMLLFGFTISVLSLKPFVFLENRYLLYLGKISYGIYMFHTIMMQLVGLIFLKIIMKWDLTFLNSILFLNFAIILLTILISHYSYKYYETYFLKKKNKYNL